MINTELLLDSGWIQFLDMHAFPTSQLALKHVLRDLECWGPPPFSADQWQTLRVVMEMAGD